MAKINQLNFNFQIPLTISNKCIGNIEVSGVGYEDKTDANPYTHEIQKVSIDGEPIPLKFIKYLSESSYEMDFIDNAVHGCIVKMFGGEDFDYTTDRSQELPDTHNIIVTLIDGKIKKTA